MLFSKDTPKARHLKLWSICLLIVSASVVFIIRVAGQPSEPFISARLVHRENLVGDAQLITMEVSNQMAFNVDYSIVVEVKELIVGSVFGPSGFTNMLDFSIMGHSQKREAIMGPSVGARWTVFFQRQLKPIEVSILKRFPWLTRHYPFNRRRSFAINGAVFDFQVSSPSTNQASKQ